MDPLLTLLLAMMMVVVGILGLRLHAFLALMAGTVVVALLTPSEAVYHTEVRSTAARLDRVTASEESRAVYQAVVTPGVDIALLEGPVHVFREQQGTVILQDLGLAEVSQVTSSDLPTLDATIACDLQLAAGDWLLSSQADARAQAAGRQVIGARIAAGFGSTCASIGILIAMAAIIGKCLLDSGAAERIVLAARSVFGEQRTPIAFVVSGFVVGVPVFFDTVFYLLMPLAKALRLKTGKNYLLYVLSVVVGATMAHSLVPPTPGPMFVATELNVSIGLMMIGGTIVGSGAACVGYLYSVWANRRWTVPLRDESTMTVAAAEAEMSRELPPLWISLLPIVLPVALLAGHAVLKMFEVDLPWFVDVVGEKNLALMLAATVALITLVMQGHTREDVSNAVQDALLSAGNIILITAAGGAFGSILRQTGMAVAIEQRLPISESGWMLLSLAFLITMVIRIAQGSATVAMLTSVGIVAPLAASVSLPYHPLYLALAIGCGSKPIMWMNDSGFWIVCRMSGMTEKETLKTVTVVLAIMGMVGFALVLLGAKFLPLVSLSS